MKIKNIHKCQTPLRVPGVGVVKFGEEVEVDDALGKSLCEGKHFEPVKSASSTPKSAK